MRGTQTSTLWAYCRSGLNAGVTFGPSFLLILKHAWFVLTVKLVPKPDRPCGLGQPVAGWLQVVGTLELASPD